MKPVQSIGSIVALALIALTAVICYANSMSVPFQWDDTINLKDIPFIQDFSYFSEPSKAEPHPAYRMFISRYVGYLSFALNYAIGGFDVTGYHLVNILIHIADGWLIYLLVELALGLGQKRSAIPLFAALLFVAHPVQTQAVTYIIQRFTSLATMFYLGSIVLYAQARSEREGSKIKYALSLACGVLAMKTKEIAFTLPFAIAMYEAIFCAGTLMRRAMRVGPFLLLLAIIPISHMGGLPDGDIAVSIDSASRLQSVLPRAEYITTELRVAVTYLRLLLLPIGQNIDYDYPVYHSIADMQVALSIILHAGLIALALFLLLRAGWDRLMKLTAFGILWFYLALTVEGLIPIEDVIFEHRVYLPSAGIIIAFVCGLYGGARQFPSLVTGRRVKALLIMLVMALSVATVMRNRVWATPVSLWEDAARKSPRKPRVINNLGDAYKSDLQYDKAIKEFSKAILINPGYGKARTNLALTYWAMGNAQDTIRQYEFYIQLWPMDFEARNNLALAYAAVGMSDKAIEQYRLAIEIDPTSMTPRLNLAMMYIGLGQKDEAKTELDSVLKLNPNEPQAMRLLGSMGN